LRPAISSQVANRPHQRKEKPERVGSSYLSEESVSFLSSDLLPLESFFFFRDFFFFSVEDEAFLSLDDEAFLPFFLAASVSCSCFFCAEVSTFSNASLCFLRSSFNCRDSSAILGAYSALIAKIFSFWSSFRLSFP